MTRPESGRAESAACSGTERQGFAGPRTKQESRRRRTRRTRDIMFEVTTVGARGAVAQSGGLVSPSLQLARRGTSVAERPCEHRRTPWPPRPAYASPGPGVPCRLSGHVPQLGLTPPVRTRNGMTLAQPGGGAAVWADRVVPLSVEVTGGERDHGELGARDLHPSRIRARVAVGLGREPGPRRGGFDEFDDDLVARERTTAPMAASGLSQGMRSRVVSDSG